MGKQPGDDNDSYAEVGCVPKMDGVCAFTTLYV